MSVGKRDPYSGHMTTGHVWNGIDELNTPVPRILFVFLGAAFLFAVGYWIQMPAWPTGNDYTRGRLGFSQSDVLNEQLATAESQRAVWEDRLGTSELDAVRDDDELMSVVLESGPALFRDNCSMCHGSGGEGGPGFPKLTDEAWLWGDKAEDVMHTLTVGINANHPGTRIGQMPAFGALGTLDGQAITDVVNYLLSLSDPSLGDGRRAGELLSVNAGKKTFATTCIACHGADAKGNAALGAPNLTDSFWLYGNDRTSLTNTIRNGRAGYMPAWESRLSETERKILTLYVLSLGS